MSRFGFVGPSYSVQSVNADCQRCVNWYVENMEDAGSKVARILCPTPGKKLVHDNSPPGTLVGQGAPGRGILTINGRTFAVSGRLLVELFANGSASTISNTLEPSTLPAGLVASFNQLLITSGRAAYVYDLGTSAFTAIPAATLSNVAAVGFSDGYFIALLKDTNKYQYSALLDATSWPALQTNQISVFPDLNSGMIVDHRELWILSQTKSVAYYNSGSAEVFDVVPSGFIDMGLVAPASVVRLDNSPFWIGRDDRGVGMGWRANAYNPVRITNHGIEYQWAQYPTIEDAVGWSYQENGHTFWMLWFQTAGKTWGYDVSTGLWHERDGIPVGFHTYNFGKHLVQDPTSGKVYEMSSAFYDDDGALIRRMRRAPHIALEEVRMFHKRLRIDAETGLGPAQPLLDGAGNSRDPQGELRWSDDGGHTWSNPRVLNFGQQGEFKTRAFANRLGSSLHGRVYEFVVSDPIPWRIIDAYLDADPGFKPQERLAVQMRKVG